MKKNRKIIVANWKMNPPTVAEARILFAKTKRVAERLERVKTVICPPLLYAGLFTNTLGNRLSLGAQDVFWQNLGRFTGAISPEMLRDSGISYCLVGHSERRALGETDEIVAKKVLGALKENISVILCVGEKEHDLEGRFYETLKNQIKSSLAGITRRYLIDLLIAYEPVWAIGKSHHDAPMPQDIREMAIFIRKTLADLYDEQSALGVPVIYGGSVEEENTAPVLLEGGVAGLLVGHKSLDAEEFTNILKIANAL